MSANPFAMLLSLVLFVIAVLVAAIAYSSQVPAAYFGTGLLVILGILLPGALILLSRKITKPADSFRLERRECDWLWMEIQTVGGGWDGS
jgi:hypothetical protein